MEGENGPATKSIASALLRATRLSETSFNRIRPVRCPATTTFWAADLVRHLPLVAPSMQSSNTCSATPSARKAEFTPLVDDGAAAPVGARWRPRTQAHGLGAERLRRRAQAAPAGCRAAWLRRSCSSAVIEAGSRRQVGADREAALHGRPRPYLLEPAPEIGELLDVLALPLPVHRPGGSK